jgi:pimeloyl-ACP methyl ester carboxylesterase
VEVEKGVKLQVIDFGGTGRPLVLIAGLGGHANGFAPFAAKLAANYHVYAITRRGFEPSSVPASGYDADRLGDDVVAVIDALKLERPILAGHSLAGEELSSIGTRHPEKVAALIYLEAAFPYAFYNAERGDLMIDANALRDEIGRLDAEPVPAKLIPLLEAMATDAARLQRDVAARQAELVQTPPPPLRKLPPAIPSQIQQIFAGERRYGPVTAVPVLAICAYPHNIGNLSAPPAIVAAIKARDLDLNGAQIDAFAKANPQAKVVRIPNASHLIFQSNEGDVLREMNAFIAALP